jgi:hypothetical protein
MPRTVRAGATASAVLSCTLAALSRWNWAAGAAVRTGLRLLWGGLVAVPTAGEVTAQANLWNPDVSVALILER